MLSILIPIYNYPVVSLVEALHQQGRRSKVPFEIICLDDGSEADFLEQNEPLRKLDSVHYELLPDNVGRARIRNILAERAQYPYLLFLDCDSAVVREDYLQHYLDVLSEDTVLYGGRLYSEHPPDDPEYYLHWRYGRQREALDPDQRQQYPYRSFMTNNYVIPRSVAKDIPFDEDIRHYGYEDTLLADRLYRENLPVRHINNPVLHLGLEPAPVFLAKIQQSLDNLRWLLPKYPQLDTRLLRAYRRLKAWGMITWLRPLAPLLLPLLESLLLRKHLGLRWLDLYKLLYFIRRTHKKNSGAS